MKTANRVCVCSKVAAGALVLAVLTVNGCVGRKAKATEGAPPTFTVKSGNTNLVMTPATSAVGRIARVNLQARFVVATFPIGQLPANDTRFSVFHAGMKVGEIRITIPPAPVGDGVSADITAGSVETGDEVRRE